MSTSGYRQPPVVRDERQLRNEFDRQNRRQRDTEQGHVIIEDPRRLLLRSPNGHYWSIGVTDAGVLTATDVGVMPR